MQLFESIQFRLNETFYSFYHNDSYLAMVIRSITAYSNGNSIDGIISKVKAQGTDPQKIINVSFSGESTAGEIESVITRNGNFQTYGGFKVWLQLDFNKYFIFPTSYTLKGVSTSTWTYSKQWTLLGFNEEDKDDEKKWDVLGIGNSCDDYCGFNEICKSDGSFHTYSLNAKKRKKGYNYLRWNVTEGSTSIYNTFSTGGIELFGKLSLHKYDAECKSLFRKASNSRLIHIIIICLLS